MKINREKLTDYLDGFLTLQEKKKLLIGAILINDKDKKSLHEELKCFGYKLEMVKKTNAKKQIIKLEKDLFTGSKIAVEFEDGAVSLFMVSLKRIAEDSNENQSNNKSALLLIFNAQQYQQLNNGEIINSVCNLI